MKLKNLTIKENRSYEDNPGKYTGEVTYEDEKGSVKLILDVGVSEAVLTCIGEVIVKFSQKVSEDLKTNIIASVEEAKRLPLIENEN